MNMTVRARSPELLQDAIEETRAVLRMDRGVDPRDEDDFTIFTNDSNIRQFNDATAGVKAGAFVIGIIALVVAGIGIMNIMLVSVTERTREIGLRKAVGARRSNIMYQFLVEALTLCMLGGVIGVIVGAGGAEALHRFKDWNTLVSLRAVVLAFAFSAVVGVFFGMWPAQRAARLDPIEALRHE